MTEAEYFYDIEEGRVQLLIEQFELLNNSASRAILNHLTRLYKLRDDRLYPSLQIALGVIPVDDWEDHGMDYWECRKRLEDMQ